MMTSDQVFNPHIWFLHIGLLTLALPLFVFALWKSLRVALIYLGVFLVFGLYLAFFSARNFGGAFGAGLALACLSATLVPISVIVWLLLRHAFQRKFADDLTRRRWYIMGGILVLVIQLIPLAGSYTIDAGCFAATRRNAAPLIAALGNYQQQNGFYPEKMSDLLPVYLWNVPAPACSWLSGVEYRAQIGFELQECPGEIMLLTSPSMNGSSIERYNFKTGNWSSVSFLDGYCNFLP
jgi:hypothetical protein